MQQSKSLIEKLDITTISSNGGSFLGFGYLTLIHNTYYHSHFFDKNLKNTTPKQSDFNPETSILDNVPALEELQIILSFFRSQLHF